jgi:hypothetical protein
MSSLTHRAEHAVIAALLADADPPFHFYGLTSSDYATALHRELHAAIMDLAITSPDLPLADRDRLIAARVDLPGARPVDLAAWRDQAPDFTATASYAELVRAGAVYRDVATHADTMATRIASGIEPGDPELAEHERKLAAALARHAAAFVSITADDGPDAGYPVDVHVEIVPVRSERAVLEDHVLAGLLRDPDQIDAVREFLTDNAFTSSLRRHVYRTMVSMTYDGEPIDEVTLAWRVEIQAAECDLHGVDVNAPGSTPDESVYPITETDTESTTGYLARLAATVSVASVVDAGRELLVTHLRDILPNPHAVAEAIMAEHADAARHAVQPSTRRKMTVVAREAPQVRAEAAWSGYTTARPPGPLPATGPEPQPGAIAAPNPTIEPGVRP